MSAKQSNAARSKFELVFCFRQQWDGDQKGASLLECGGGGGPVGQGHRRGGQGGAGQEDWRGGGEGRKVVRE